MNFLFPAIVLLILLSPHRVTLAEEGETPVPAPPVSPESRPINLDEAIKQVMKESKNKLLGAKTEVEQGKKVHIIKVLTADGHIQYIKIEADTGKLITAKK